MSQGSESRREVARSAPSAPKGSTLLAAAPTEPHALPESRSTADPGPRGPEAAQHPLPRPSREPHKDTHRRNTCRQTLTLWTERQRGKGKDVL